MLKGKNIHFAFLFVLIFLCNTLRAQDAYWVYLGDKDGVSFDPYSFFDPKAISRRVQHQFDLNHIEDLPVRADYIKSVSGLVDTVIYASRWFNALGVWAAEDQIVEVGKLSFVIDIEKIESNAFPASTFSMNLDSEPDPFVESQTSHLGGGIFREHGVNGKGVRIAILDAGFPGVNTHEMFEHIREDGRILKTWDFTSGNQNVYLANQHGANVLSCIAGIYDGQYYGLAPEAEFLLARTEVRKEPFSEEIYWEAAMEWADQNGADIINSSLGYTHHRYFPEQMDGRTAFVSRAAVKAARRGILVVNAAGNEGDGSWKRIGAPADADSILTVGGINPNTGYHTSFSSYGPTSDFRLKPNVSAFGHVMAAGKADIDKTQGTSFSSPLVAGFAACVKQLSPGLTNMQLLYIIQESASLYPYYDYAHGYGIPQANFFFDKEKTDSLRTTPTFNAQIVHDELVVEGNELFDKILERGNDLLYLNFEKKDGVLTDYFVFKVTDRNMLRKDISLYTETKKLNIHFAGYTKTIELNQ